MRDAAFYREQAARFREMAVDCDEATAAALIMMAEDHEAEAERLDPDIQPPMPTLE